MQYPANRQSNRVIFCNHLKKAHTRKGHPQQVPFLIARNDRIYFNLLSASIAVAGLV